MGSWIEDVMGWVIGGVMALFAWVLKVTFDNSKRITALEARMDNLPQATASKVIEALSKQNSKGR